MSEAEQDEVPQQVAELTAELAEVRKKRDQLDTQNLRVTGNLRRTIEERDKAVKMVAALQEQVHAASKDLKDMTAQRDEARKASADVLEQLADRTAERDAARKFAGDTQYELSQLQVEHDAVKEQLARCREEADILDQENTSLQDTVRQLRAKQVHGDMPGLLHAIHLAVEQARELI